MKDWEWLPLRPAWCLLERRVLVMLGEDLGWLWLFWVFSQRLLLRMLAWITVRHMRYSEDWSQPDTTSPITFWCGIWTKRSHKVNRIAIVIPFYGFTSVRALMLALTFKLETAGLVKLVKKQSLNVESETRCNRIRRFQITHKRRQIGSRWALLNSKGVLRRTGCPCNFCPNKVRSFSHI